MDLIQDYAYNAMRSVLSAILKYNRSAGKMIVTVAIPSFGLEVHTMEEQNLMVKQMALAYRNFYYPKSILPTMEEAEMLDRQIHSSVAGKQSERIAKITEELISGNLVKRGLYDEEELSVVIQHMYGKDPEIA
jgi:hypothetical protein